mgnify:CR=1 FL=1
MRDRLIDREFEILGEEKYFGPLSPDELIQVDRPLTAAEQKFVSDWQGKEANRQLAEERAKGGPTSSTISVTPQGAIIMANPVKLPSMAWLLAIPIIGAGLYLLVRWKK